MKRFFRLLLNAVAGAICAGALPLALVALGWTQALTRRAVWRRLHREAGYATPFPDFAGAAPITADIVEIPRWIARRGVNNGRPELTLHRRFGEGVGAIATLGLLTLPAGALWLAGWHIGWNHSFHKSYELATVGPMVSLLGIALFVVAMLYAPVAQVHQAVSRDPRAFFHVSAVRAVLAANPLGCAQLAAWYALLSLPVVALKTAPMAFDRFEGAALLDEAGVLAQLQGYYFWAGGVVFGCFVFLRTRAAKLYARGLPVALARSPGLRERLSPALGEPLARLGLGTESPAPENRVAAAALDGARLAWRGAMATGAALLWLSFAAQIFVTEFLNYHGPQGWLNQPLVQLPWFRYLPPGLG